MIPSRNSGGTRKPPGRAVVAHCRGAAGGSELAEVAEAAGARIEACGGRHCAPGAVAGASAAGPDAVGRGAPAGPGSQGIGPLARRNLAGETLALDRIALDLGKLIVGELAPGLIGRRKQRLRSGLQILLARAQGLDAGAVRENGAQDAPAKQSLSRNNRNGPA
jgi:hypothetical protein